MKRSGRANVAMWRSSKDFAIRPLAAVGPLTCLFCDLPSPMPFANLTRSRKIDLSTMQESNQYCSGPSKSARPFFIRCKWPNRRSGYDKHPQTLRFASHLVRCHTYVASNHRAYLPAHDITRGALLRSRHRSPSIAQENRAALESVLWQATLA